MTDEQIDFAIAAVLYLARNSPANSTEQAVEFLATASEVAQALLKLKEKTNDNPSDNDQCS